MPTVTLAEAQDKLPELIEQLTPGDEFTITRDGKPIAILVALAPSHRRAGSGRGQLTVISEDDEHSEDFAEYK